MQDLHEGWAAAVRQEMADQGVTQAELARRCDVHPSTINRIIQGELTPNDELKWKIAGALGKRMDELWAWPRIVPPNPYRSPDGAAA